MLAVLAIGVWGGDCHGADITQGETRCRAFEEAWQSGAFVAQVSAFFYTHMPPCCAEVGGGLSHSYAFAQNMYYVKLLHKSFNINDLQAAQAVGKPCSLRKPQHIVCANH